MGTKKAGFWLLWGMLALCCVACSRAPSDASFSHLATATPCPFPPIRATATPVGTPAPTPAMAPEAAAYLETTLTHIRRHAVRQERLVDWWAYHDHIMALGGTAQTITETYPVIDFALTQLCDNHSFLARPAAASGMAQGQQHGFGLRAVYPGGWVVEVLPGSPAAEAGIRVGDQVRQVNGRPPVPVADTPYVDLGRESPVTLALQRDESQELAPFTLEQGLYNDNPPVNGRRLDPNVGYIELPRFLGEGEPARRYAAGVQQLIREIDQAAPCGWVVDLRRNSGGNVWPMLLGVAPLLGRGWAGSFIDAEERVTRWTIRPDEIRLGAQSMVAIEGDGYRLQTRTPPVAVLTSRLTASAGEAVVVAFLGREKTRLFGEMTVGVTSANRARPMEDGALLFVATALFADPSGQTYDGKIVPDEPLTVDWPRLGQDDDPVLQATLAWLRQHPGCR